MILNKILKYVAGKFFELGVLAGLLFYLASLVDPTEYSKLLPLLVSISVSTIIYSGLGSSYIKQAALSKYGDGEILLAYFYQSLIVGGVLCLFGLLLQDMNAISILSSIILFFNSFRSFGQSFYRSQLNEVGIIIFNLIYPIFTLLIFFVCYFLLDCSAVSAYIFGVFGGMAMSSFYIVYIILRDKAGEVTFPCSISLLKKWRTPLQHLILNSSVFGFIYSDKIIALKIMDSDFIGQFQLYENFTNLFYMGVSSCLYLLSPYLLKRYGDKEGFDRTGFFQVFFFICILMSAFVYSFIAKIFIGNIYPIYFENIMFFDYQLTIKALALTLFLPSIYFMKAHKEYLFVLIIYVFFSFVLFNVWIEELYVNSLFKAIVQSITGFLFLGSLLLNGLMFKWNRSNG